MSRTVRNPIGERRWYRTESKWARKMTNRRHRNRMNVRLRTAGDFDELVIDRMPATSGWISH